MVVLLLKTDTMTKKGHLLDIAAKKFKTLFVVLFNYSGCFCLSSKFWGLSTLSFDI